MSVQRVSILLSKYLLLKEEELFYWWKVSKFLLAPLFANARRVDVSKFRVENTAILRLRPRKLIFLLFSKIKAFLRDNLHQITYLPKSYLWTKMKEIDFSTLATGNVAISWPSLLRWLPRVFTNNPSYLAYVTERNQLLCLCDFVLEIHR